MSQENKATTVPTRDSSDFDSGDLRATTLKKLAFSIFFEGSSVLFTNTLSLVGKWGNGEVRNEKFPTQS